MLDLESWRAAVIAANEFHIRPIAFHESTEWSFRDGMLVHRSGGFFALAGLAVEARHADLDGRQQLVIRQRDVAINGLLLRNTPLGCEALFQGRVEPGNVGTMQLAPTVQSTQANYLRRHGGKETAFIESFVGDDAAIYDVLQSEEGSRYHGKYNRNVVKLLPPVERDIPDNFRFVPFEWLARMIEVPNTLNTDSRSVLFCVDWSHLTWPRPPFVDRPGDLSRLLAASYRRLSDAGLGAFDALAWLARLRAEVAIASRPVAIEKLTNWDIRPDRICERVPQTGFCARQFHVVARQREVAAWDQPLIDSATRGRVVLLCQVRDGVLQFLVSAAFEIGFLEGVQLSASIVVPPGQPETALSSGRRALLETAETPGSRRIAACVQSEEGGRFFQDENLYEIVMLDPALPVAPHDESRWMTLGQIAALKPVPGALAIELRCILALLLKHA